MLKYLKEVLGSMFNAQNPLGTFTHSPSGILSVTFYKVLEEAMHTGTLRTMANAELGKLDSLLNFTGVLVWGLVSKILSHDL